MDATKATPTTPAKTNKSWWGFVDRQRHERRYCVLIAILSVIAIVMIVLIGLNIGMRPSGYCTTSECYQSAVRMLAMMDLSADPCDDFYQYACGSFLSSQVPVRELVPNTMREMPRQFMLGELKKALESNIETEDQIFKQMKIFYNSCLNQKSLNEYTILSLLNKMKKIGIGSWPMLNKTWAETDLHLESRIAVLVKHYNEPFFDLALRRVNDSVPPHLWIGGPQLFYYHSDLYHNHSLPLSKEVLSAYKELMANTFHRLGVPKLDAHRNAQNIIDFETNIAQLAKEHINNASENSIKVKDLQERYPQLNWYELLQQVYQNTSLDLETIEDIDVMVGYEDYLSEVLDFVANSSARMVADYLSWRYFATVMPYLEPGIVHLYRKYHLRTLKYHYEADALPFTARAHVFKTPWKTCVLAVSVMFPAPSINILENRMISSKTKSELKEMVTHVKSALLQALRRQTWLNDTMKTLIEEKLPPVIFATLPIHTNETFLENVYGPVDLRSDDPYLIQLNHLWNNRFRVSTLKTLNSSAVVRSQWGYIPLDVEASAGNRIEISAGLLAWPFYLQNRPRYLNYGTLGFVVGHEYGHIVDIIDWSRTVKDGEPSDDIIKRGIGCLDKQYSTYEISDLNFTINGSYTIHDNLADNIGLQSSFKAYLEYEKYHGREKGLPGLDLTNHQLFFLANAQIWCRVYHPSHRKLAKEDVHSHSKYRVIGTVVNSNSFGKVFNCPRGSPMNPSSKCRLYNID